MNPLFYTMARGAEDAAQAAGMTMVLGNSDDDTELEANHLRIMAEHRVDGIILVPTPYTTAAHIPTLPAKVPLVLLDRRPSDLAASLVCCDTATATRDLCQYLYALGHERVAIIGDAGGTHLAQPACWLPTGAAQAGRMEDEDLVIHGNYRAESGAAATRELMASTRPPDAIIAASAQVLYGMLDELAAQGNRSPPTSPFAVSMIRRCQPRPRFTYVEQPGYAMGAAAVQIILEGLRQRRRRERTGSFRPPCASARVAGNRCERAQPCQRPLHPAGSRRS